MQDKQITRLELEAIIFTDYFEANRFYNSIEKPMTPDTFAQKLIELLNEKTDEARKRDRV